MPKDSNYFEEAMKLSQDHDPNVSRLAESLYRTMLMAKQQQNMSPIGNFNILYFVQTVIRAWLVAQPGVELSDTRFPLPCEPIKGINRPTMGKSRNTFIEHFINLVMADSVPN